MKVVFIRHGEPDYLSCDEKGFIGHGRDLALRNTTGRRNF